MNKNELMFILVFVLLYLAFLSFQVHQRQKNFHQKYHLEKHIDIDYIPEKLCLCNDELWVANGDKGVFQYNLGLELINCIEHPQFKWITSFLKTPTGVIVCDCYRGLHHFNHQGDYTNLICSDLFSDVCLTRQNKIYALNYKQGEIHTFVRNQSSWVKDTQFKLAEYSDGFIADKLCTTSTHMYVSSWNYHCILVYTLNGEYVYKTGGSGDEVGKFNSPLLSDVSGGGKLLVCDSNNHRLQEYDTQSRVWSELSGLEEVKYPRCAGVGDKHLWVGTANYPFKLLQFEYTQK